MKEREMVDVGGGGERVHLLRCLSLSPAPRLGHPSQPCVRLCPLLLPLWLLLSAAPPSLLTPSHWADAGSVERRRWHRPGLQHLPGCQWLALPLLLLYPLLPQLLLLVSGASHEMSARACRWRLKGEGGRGERERGVPGRYGGLIDR